MALVYIRPDADTDDGNWVNASGNNTNLYDSLNESVASDSDYIRSGNNPVNDIVKLRLGNFSSVPDEPMTVRYRFKKVVSAGEVLSLKVRLIEGDAPGTTIAEWEHDGVADTYTDGEQELTSGQFALISDFDDLYLEFEAISGALEVILPGEFDASYLLTDETSGVAINAMYPGGSVAIINGVADLDDVELDAATSVLGQAGTSPKMVHWHEAPYVRWSAHNMALQSQTLGTTWAQNELTLSTNATTAPDGTSTAEKLLDSTNNTIHYLSQACTTIVGFVYTASFYVKAAERSWCAIGHINGANTAAYFNLSTGAVGTTQAGVVGTSVVDAGNGWWRLGVAFVADATTNGPVVFIATADNTVSYTGNGTGIYAWGGQYNRGYIPTPYLVTTSAARIGIPQSYDIDEDCFGILIESVGTNKCLQSENLDPAGPWDVSGVSYTANATTAPDGSTTADTLDDNDAGAVEYLTQTIGSMTDAVYTASVYMKAGTSSVGYLGFSAGGGDDFAVFVDLTNGNTLERTGIDTATSITSTSVGNGWYRVTLSGDTNSTGDVTFILAPAGRTNMSAGSLDNAGTGTAYFWGAQFELGTVASSYIPTLGSTVTRAVDAVAKGAFGDNAIDVSGCIVSQYMDGKSTVFRSGKPMVGLGYNGGNCWMFEMTNPPNVTHVVWNCSTGEGGGDDAVVDTGTATSGVRYDAAGRMKEDDVAGSFNGAAVVTDATADVPADPSSDYTFFIGSYSNVQDWTDSSFGNFMLYRWVLVPRAVIDADLPTWRHSY